MRGAEWVRTLVAVVTIVKNLRYADAMGASHVNIVVVANDKTFLRRCLKAMQHRIEVAWVRFMEPQVFRQEEVLEMAVYACRTHLGYLRLAEAIGNNGKFIFLLVVEILEQMSCARHEACLSGPLVHLVVAQVQR